MGPYAGGIPRPEQILGYEAGSTHSTFRQIEQVVFGIAAAAKDRVKVIEFGRSVEGRPLRLIAVSSPANMRRLDQLRKQNQDIANGNVSGINLAEAPVFVWINEGIHGNETASFEAGMWTLYNLVASRNPKVVGALENTVVLINPAYNPDGHERFVVYSNSVAVGSPHPQAFERGEPDIIHGRTNHYRFDMNRDRVAMSQDETRAEVTEFLKWNPQVYIDQHGQTEEYFFPPNPMSINANIGRERLNKWTEVFGRAYGREFDKRGWLYFTRDAFDAYFTGYLDSYAALCGAIGMTHETDGGRAIAEVKADGSPVTLRLGLEKHFVTAMETVMTSASHRKDLMQSFSEFKRRANDGSHAGKFRRVIVTSEDPRPLGRLAEQLHRAGVKVGRATAGFTQATAHDYWSDKVGSQQFPSGSLVIELAQPLGPLAKSLLEPHAEFEPEFIKRQNEIAEKLKGERRSRVSAGFEFYDITAWSVIYAHNLRAWWCEDTERPSVGEPRFAYEPSVIPESEIGWALAYRDTQDVLAAIDLATAGYKTYVGTAPMRLDGIEYQPGTLFYISGRNPAGLKDALAHVSKKRGVRFLALTSLFPDSGRSSIGSNDSTFVGGVRVGIVFGSDSWTTDFGGAWYLFDREFKIPFTPLNVDALSGSLAEFSCVILPAGNYESVPNAFKEWVRNGGCAVVLGRPRWAISEGFLNLKDETKEAKRLPGTMFAAEVERDSNLSFGYGAGQPFAAMVSYGLGMKAGDAAGGVVRFPANSKSVKLLSGWSWPGETETTLAGSVAVYEQRVGRGRVVAFLEDPCERAMWPGQYKMLLNAVLFNRGVQIGVRPGGD